MDGPYRRAVAEACGFWLIANLLEMPGPALDLDTVWGVATRRQRIVRRLAAFTGAVDESGPSVPTPWPGTRQGRTPRELAEQQGHTACADVRREAVENRPGER